MADEKKTVIIDVEVGGEADEQIADLNKTIKSNREQIKELSKDYADNAKEIAVLERSTRNANAEKREIIKTNKAEVGSLNDLRRQLAVQTKERNNLNKSTEEGAKRFEELQLSIAGLNEEISGFEQVGGDFRRNVGNYPDLLGAADDATGGFITSLSGLINPLTAVATGVAAVGAAYVKTGRGSADLARAQDRLSTAFVDVGNSIADLTDDEGGIIDNFLKGLQTQLFGVASTIRSDVIVAIKEQIREFQLAQLESDRLAKSLLDQAEQQRQIRDEERNTLNQRRRANQELLDIINEREAEQIKTQEAQIANLQTLLKLDEENLELQVQLKEAEFELADIREEAQGFRSEQAANDLALARESSQQRSELRRLELEEELLFAEEGSRREFEIRQQIINESLAIELEAVGNNLLARQILEQEAKNNLLALEEEFVDEKISLLEKNAAAEEKARNERLRAEQKAKDEAGDKELKTAEAIQKSKENLLKGGVANVKTILGEGESIQKAFALTEIGVDTAKAIGALTAAAEANPGNAFTFGGAGIAQFAAGILRIGANIKSATDLIGTSTQVPTGAGGGGGTSSSTGGALDRTLSNVNAGLLSQFSNSSTTASATAAATGEAVGGNLPPIQVSVVDINNAQSSRSVKVTEASLG